jgi:hypothetical protein
MSDDEYGVTPRGRASSNELLQLVESFEDLIKHRQAEAAWAMYRRIIVCFIGMVSREQLKIKETRNARPSRASIGSRFKLAAKTVMVRVGPALSRPRNCATCNRCFWFRWVWCVAR